MSIVARAWNGFRRQPVHLLCWGAFFAIIAWAVFRSFPMGFDPMSDSSNYNGSDFTYYFSGAQGVWNGTDPYARFDFGGRVNHSYNYPPLIATLLSPLVPLGITDAARVWFVINTSIVVALFVLSYRLIAQRFRLPTDLLSMGAVIALSAGLAIELIRREVGDIQTDTLMIASLLGMLVAMDRRSRIGLLPGWLVWPMLAGLCLAFGIHIKFLLVVFLPYLLVTRRLSVLAWSVFWVVAIFLGTAGLFGWEENARFYATSLGGAGRVFGVDPAADGGARVHDIVWVHSISIPSMFARLLSGETTVNLLDRAPEYSRAMVFGLTGLVSLVCVGIAWVIYRAQGIALFAQFWSKQHQPDPETRSRRALVEVCMVMVVQLAFSPQTMKRHIFLAIPVIMLAASLALLRRRSVSAIPAWIALAVLAAGLNLPPGGSANAELVRVWKWHSGASWCLLIFAFLTMWTSLRTIRAIDRGEPIADPPPERARWFTRPRA